MKNGCGLLVAYHSDRKALFYTLIKYYLLGMTLLLLDCPLDGDESDHLGLDLVHLRHHFANHLVHLSLVVHVQLGKGEEGNPAENNQGEGVEPGTKVCQEPEGKAKLDGVHHGLDQEESPQFEDSGVDGVSKARGGRGNGIGRDGQGELSDLSIKSVFVCIQQKTKSQHLVI